MLVNKRFNLKDKSRHQLPTTWSSSHIEVNIPDKVFTRAAVYTKHFHDKWMWFCCSDSTERRKMDIIITVLTGGGCTILGRSLHISHFFSFTLACQIWDRNQCLPREFRWTCFFPTAKVILNDLYACTGNMNKCNHKIELPLKYEEKKKENGDFLHHIFSTFYVALTKAADNKNADGRHLC